MTSILVLYVFLFRRFSYHSFLVDKFVFTTTDAQSDRSHGLRILYDHARVYRHSKCSNLVSIRRAGLPPGVTVVNYQTDFQMIGTTINSFTCTLRWTRPFVTHGISFFYIKSRSRSIIHLHLFWCVIHHRVRLCCRFWVHSWRTLSSPCSSRVVGMDTLIQHY